jgi:hypothetical protein
MKSQPLAVNLLSAVPFLALLPGSQAFPQWLKPHRREPEIKFAPRQYTVYEGPPQYGGSYTYGGNGPLPTLSSYPSSSSSISTTTDAAGEVTYSSAESSCKSLPDKLTC